MPPSDPSGAKRLLVARPWLDLREKWQAIFDSAGARSDVERQARERLAYIDGNLRRLDGR